MQDRDVPSIRVTELDIFNAETVHSLELDLRIHRQVGKLTSFSDHPLRYAAYRKNQAAPLREEFLLHHIKNNENHKIRMK